MKLKSKLKDKPDNKLTDRHKLLPKSLSKELKELLTNENKDLRLKSKLKELPMTNMSEGLSSPPNLPPKELSNKRL